MAKIAFKGGARMNLFRPFYIAKRGIACWNPSSNGAFLYYPHLK